MANFNAHKPYFRAVMWAGTPDGGTAAAVSSPGGFWGGWGASLRKASGKKP